MYFVKDIQNNRFSDFDQNLTDSATKLVTLGIALGRYLDTFILKYLGKIVFTNG